MILGWIANWKPIETFLYDCWPLKRQRDLCRRLREAVVEVKAHRAGRASCHAWRASMARN